MKNLRDGKRVIETRRGNRITMDKLFKAKEQFHIASSKMPFEEKIKILIKMWEIVKSRH